MYLTSEKIAQAKRLIQTAPFDAWLVFVRETTGGGDPVLPLILEGGLTWQSALVITKSGKSAAILGNYDADPLKASGDWDEVIPYVQGIREPLVEWLRKELPAGAKIGINFSTNDVKADGLTHGMFQLLSRYLDGTGFSLVSAEELVMALRGQKTPEEIKLIQAAIAEGDRIFEKIGSWIVDRPSEREVYDRVHGLMRERGLGFGWDPAGDPIVNTGPDSMIGHGVPNAKLRPEPGHIFHVDLGVIKDGYSSDIQRCWYVADKEPLPDEVRKALDAVNAAIDAGAQTLKPGVSGWEVDAAARRAITGAGYEEYHHALGHQVGRSAHDGGAILGPKWDRYGQTPIIPIQKDEVYTLELGVILPGRGYLGIEEIVVVTDDGCRFLSVRQLDMPIVRLAETGYTPFA